MYKIIFYTQLGQKNCDQAYLMLMEVAYEMPLEIDVVDISLAHNHELYDHYVDRIPVLHKIEGEVELAWPFTEADVKKYLA